MNRMLLPLQGDITHIIKTQGAALGCKQAAPSGRTCESRVALFIILLALFSPITSGGQEVKTAGAAAVTIAKSDYRPQTSWPYVFAEFQKAEIHTDNEADSSDVVEVGIPALYNIHLRGSLLHYVDQTDSRVHHALFTPSQYIVLSGKKYIVRDGKVMELLSRHGGTELLLQTDGQWQQLFRYQGAAYGMSMSASANEGLYNSELEGLDRPLYEVLCQRKADGREILLEDVYYLSSAPSLSAAQQGGAKVEKVSRKAFEELLTKPQRPLFRQFCKDNDINFRDGKDIRKAFAKVIEMIAKSDTYK